MWVVRPHMDAEAFDMVDTFSTDDRGRITLGSEWADTRVRVFVEDLHIDARDTERPDEEVRAVLSDMARWARKNDHTPMGYRPESGKVLTTDADWVDTPYSLED